MERLKFYVPGVKVFYKNRTWKIIRVNPGGSLVIRRWPFQKTVRKDQVF